MPELVSRKPGTGQENFSYADRLSGRRAAAVVTAIFPETRKAKTSSPGLPFSFVGGRRLDLASPLLGLALAR